MNEDEIDDARKYRCLSCKRTVDMDLEPSSGAPVRCQDCDDDRERTLDLHEPDVWT